MIEWLKRWKVRHFGPFVMVTIKGKTFKVPVVDWGSYKLHYFVDSGDGYKLVEPEKTDVPTD
jgi:hypothetical protein